MNNITNFTVSFGFRAMPRSVPAPATIGAVLSDRDLKVFFGWGDSLRAIINGVEMDADVVIPEGSHVTVETRANSKAQ